jgi:hypothetical protein
MRFNKMLVVFSLTLILMLSLGAIVRAEPPQGRSIASDHLELNALGKAGVSQSLADQEEPGEDIPDDDTGDTDDDDTGDGDDGDTGDDSSDDTMKEHPVAASMAEHFELEYDQIKSLHDQGAGFGNLAKAFFLAQMNDGEGTGDLLGMATQILEEAKQQGWGQVKKDYAGHPGNVGSVGSIMGKGKKPVPEPDDPGDSLSASAESGSTLNANGNGLGHGHEKNDGKSKGKAKGKGKK